MGTWWFCWEIIHGNCIEVQINEFLMFSDPNKCCWSLHEKGNIHPDWTFQWFPSMQRGPWKLLCHFNPETALWSLPDGAPLLGDEQHFWLSWEKLDVSSDNERFFRLVVTEGKTGLNFFTRHKSSDTKMTFFRQIRRKLTLSKTCLYLKMIYKTWPKLLKSLNTICFHHVQHYTNWRSWAGRI